MMLKKPATFLLGKSRHSTKWRLILALVAGLCTGAFLQSANQWTEEEIQLANQYLGWLIEKPDDQEMVNLLWELYQKHHSEEFLLKSLQTQSEQQEVLEAHLVYAQLLNKAGQFQEAFEVLQLAEKKFGSSISLLNALAGLAEKTQRFELQLGYIDQLIEKLEEQKLSALKEKCQLAELYFKLHREQDAESLWSTIQSDPLVRAEQLKKALQFHLARRQYDKSLELYRRLIKKSEVADRWPLYLEASQIADLKGDQSLAERFILEGMEGLAPQHKWHERFFVRWYKLHERHGTLKEMAKQLYEVSEAQGFESYKPLAWWQLYRFYTFRNEPQESYKWIELLAKTYPQTALYRQSWLTQSLEHGKLDLVLGQLNKGFDELFEIHESYVFLKAKALLLSAQSKACSQWLLEGGHSNKVTEDVKKQIRVFAKTHGLFETYERMMLESYRANGGSKDGFLELAKHYQQLNRKSELDAWVNQYLHEKPSERAARLAVIAEFYGQSSSGVNMEKLTRDAAISPDAGREEWLQLVDILISEGKIEEALQWLEKAVSQSATLEEVIEVDERIYSVLAGGNAPMEASQKPSPVVELTSLFTGVGFGEEEKPQQIINFVPEEIQVYALEKIYPFLEDKTAFQVVMDELSEIPYNQLERELPYVRKDHPLAFFRAVWWASRAKFTTLAEKIYTHQEYQKLKSRQEFELILAKLSFEIALEKKDAKSIENGLAALPVLDPANALNYELRLVEWYLSQSDAFLREAAIEKLEALARNKFYDDQVLSLLSQLYFESGRKEDAMGLWTDAIEASQYQNPTLIERYSEILMVHQDAKRFWSLVGETLLRETTLTKREQTLRRALDRVTSWFTKQEQVDDVAVNSWVDHLWTFVDDSIKQHPLDSFWHLAKSVLQQRSKQAAPSYESLKRAYYLQPENLEILRELKLAAERLGRHSEAIEFQQQYAQFYREGKDFFEWQSWIQLLENQFQIERADRARSEMEFRFSNDLSALESMVQYYQTTGQKYRVRRVLDQLGRLADSHPELQLKVAQEFEKCGDLVAAQGWNEKWLELTRVHAEEALAADFWLEDPTGQGTAPTWFLESLQNSSIWNPKEREQLLQFYTSPISQLEEDPDQVPAKRLQVIKRWWDLNERLGHLQRDFPENLLSSDSERFWLTYFAKDKQALRGLLAARKDAFKDRANEATLQGWVNWMWLALESDQAGVVMDELSFEMRASSTRESLLRWWKGVLYLHAEKKGGEWNDEFIKNLSQKGWLTKNEWMDLLRKFEFKRDYSTALRLFDALLAHYPEPHLELLMHQSKIANLAGDFAKEKAVLKAALECQPKIQVGSWSAFDPWIQLLRRYLALCPNHQERQEVLLKVRDRWLRDLPVAHAPLRYARLDGLFGALEKSKREAMDAQLQQGILPHPFAEPLMSRLLPGTHREHGPQIDYESHLGEYWDSLHEWQISLPQDGLLSLLQSLDQHMEMHFGGVQLGSSGAHEFRTWKIHQLGWALWNVKSAKRKALVEEFVAQDSSIEALGELGAYLEAHGFYRECLYFYKDLPRRAPTNNDYSEQFLRASDRAWVSEPAVDYLSQLIVAVAEMKPNMISREQMREKHAYHLARLQRIDELEKLGKQPIAATRRGTVGRPPEPSAYLRTLGRWYTGAGQLDLAERKWRELLEIMPEDGVALLELAKLLEARGEKEALKELLRRMQFTSYWDNELRDLFLIKLRLHAQTNDWLQVDRMLKILQSSQLAPQGMWIFNVTPTESEVLTAETYVESCKILAKHEHASTALNVLLKAVRGSKSVEARARYLSQLIPWLDLKKTEHQEVAKDVLVALQEMPASILRENASLLDGIAEVKVSKHLEGWKKLLSEWKGAPKSGMLLTMDLMFFEEADLKSKDRLKDWKSYWAADSQAALVWINSLSLRGLGAQAQLLMEEISFDASQLAVRFELAAQQKDEGTWRQLQQRHATWFQAQKPMVRMGWWKKLGRQDVVAELLEDQWKAMVSQGYRDAEVVRFGVEHWLELGDVDRAEAILVRHSCDLTEDLPNLIEKVYKRAGEAKRVPNWEALDLPDALRKECEFVLKE